MRRAFLAIAFYFIFLFAANATVCTGRFVNPATDVCWDCMFPMSIGAMESPPSTTFRPDTVNFPSPICMCPEKWGPLPIPGIAIGLWEPIRLTDITKRPFCFPSLGGKSLMPPGLSLMGTGAADSDENDATWHLHWHVAPFLGILSLIIDIGCLEFATYDLAYMTEFDPLFHDGMLSLAINPEAILFANPIAQLACAADCIAATSWTPLDPLFWCAGCQGGLYPFTGNNAGAINSIQSATLQTEKFIFKLHRQLMLPDTSGPESICFPIPAPIIKKSQYRIQTTVPIPGMGPYGCTPFGRSTVLHESMKEIPFAGEDFGFLTWRKRNCCFL